jgi:hypothetical protein
VRASARPAHRVKRIQEHSVAAAMHSPSKLLFVAIGLLAAAQAAAQSRTVQDEQDLLNWYYAATYGTGVYTAGDRTVAVLQIPIAYTLRPTTDDRSGLRLNLPVSFGFYDYEFNDVLDQGLPSRVGTVSVMPGIEMDMRVTSRWKLRPYFAAGMGWELSGHESAWIYEAGLRSRFLMIEHRGVDFSLLNRLSLAGFYPSGGPNQPLSLFAVGLDVLVPTGTELYGRPLYISFTPIYYNYFKRLYLPEFDNPDNRIGHETEIAITFSTSRPFTIAGMDFDRLGIALRTSDELSGVRIFTSLPF